MVAVAIAAVAAVVVAIAAAVAVTETVSRDGKRLALAQIIRDSLTGSAPARCQSVSGALNFSPQALSLFVPVVLVCGGALEASHFSTGPFGARVVARHWSDDG